MESTNEEAQTPKFSFPKDGDRPITEYATNVKFRPNDQVCLVAPGSITPEGPYTVSFVDKGQYKLCDAKGNPVGGGKMFTEKELKFYDPFG